MSDKGTGDTEVVEFEQLDMEEAPEVDVKAQIATFLKEKLSEEDFSAAAKILGVDTDDLSNAELLEKLTELMKPGEKKEEEEPEEETEMMDYKDFMKDCMKEGKNLKECGDEWKKKYPEPKEEAALAKEEDEKDEDEKMGKLELRIAELEGALELEKISNEVDSMVHAKHLAPIQKDSVVKLSARLSEEDRALFLDVFKTQKFKVAEDVGHVPQNRPGATQFDIDDETRAKIMKSHGLSALISDKGVRNN